MAEGRRGQRRLNREERARGGEAQSRDDLSTQRALDTAWASLPDTAVYRIALLLQGVDALHFCGTCTAFRSVQPELEVLVIGGYFRAPEPGPEAQGLTVRLGHDSRGRAHRIIESISPRHAGELSTLYVSAAQGDPNVITRLSPELQHGARLTALRELHLEHPAAGWTGGEHLLVPPNTLQACATQLIISVSSTLHTLEVRACIRLSANDFIRTVPFLASLRRLDVNLVPWTAGFRPLPRMGVLGNPDDTRRVAEAVREHCGALLAPANIICHRFYPGYLD
jgi:hypothetical protein